MKLNYEGLSKKLIMRKYANRFTEYMGVKSLFIIDKNRFPRQFRRLTRGLDHNSIQTIKRILGRVRKYLNVPFNAGEEALPFINYNKKERKFISRVINEFEPSIEKCGERCYKYMGYKLPIRHFEVNVFYHQCSIPLLKDKEKIRKGAIIDVGAYIGDSSIVMSAYTDQKVYAFEPVEGNYQMMQETLALNPEVKNIVPVKAALGAEKAKVEINLGESSSSLAFKLMDKVEEVQVIKLDDFVRENNVHISLIKVDVEGAEQLFLKGAEQTIKTQKPSLIISIYHNSSDFFDIKPMIEKWNLGYKFRVVKPIDAQVLYETVLLAEL